MRAEEFEKLIELAKLVPLSSCSHRFLIGLQVNTGYGVHVECELAEYLPAELAEMPLERAQSQIEAIRQRLIKKVTEKLRIEA